MDLLLGFNLITGHSFFVSLIICWAITPGAMIVVGIIGESRLIPLTPSRQYLGFSPGDFFLGIGVASGLQVVNRLPDSTAWWNQRWFHLMALLAAAIFASVMMRLEVASGGHTAKEMYSPVGLYHSLVLYGGYGYVIGVVALAMVFGADWSDEATQQWGALSAVGVGLFIILVYLDGRREFDSSETYVEKWQPIWRRSAT